tara:strand:- start:103 stop:288 length:186 start_codon:yes stop_codon:yes gene_type:complete
MPACQGRESINGGSERTAAEGNRRVKQKKTNIFLNKYLHGLKMLIKKNSSIKTENKLLRLP